MSTKTTFKRVALVAVAALGMGVLSSVAPASAATKTPTSITVGTIPSASVGTVHTTPVTIAFPAGTGSDTFAISVRVTAAPTGSGYKNFQSDLRAGATTTGTNIKAKVTVELATGNDGLFAYPASSANATSSSDGQTVAGTYTSSNATGTAASAKFNINVTPDKAGTYTVLVSTRGSDGTALVAATVPVYAAGDASKTYSFATGVAPTTATLAAVTGATVTGATATTGRLMSLTLNTGAVLGAGETITLTTNNTSAKMGAVTDQTAGTVDTQTATYVLDSADFVAGVAYFMLSDVSAAATTTVVTATGSGL